MNAVTISRSELEVCVCPACTIHLMQEGGALAPRPHPRTSSASGLLFSKTFSLCSCDLGVPGSSPLLDMLSHDS